MIKLNTLEAQEDDVKLHLYMAWGCPFCHRILAALVATELLDKISITWTKNIKGPEGWKLNPDEEPLYQTNSLKDLYNRLSMNHRQIVSVPLLVNLTDQVILSTDSFDIVRFISKGFNGIYSIARDIAPDNLVDQIDAKNEWLHRNVNRAVYLVGFATKQNDYQIKLTRLFKALDYLEEELKDKSFLISNQLTECDLYLLPTLERFDTIYYWLFKCNLKRLEDYPNLSAYLISLRATANLYSTYNATMTEEHYYLSTMHVQGELRNLNPSNIVPDVIQLSKLRIASP